MLLLKALRKLFRFGNFISPLLLSSGTGGGGIFGVAVTVLRLFAVFAAALRSSGRFSSAARASILGSTFSDGLMAVTVETPCK